MPDYMTSVVEVEQRYTTGYATRLMLSEVLSLQHIAGQACYPWLITRF